MLKSTLDIRARIMEAVFAIVHDPKVATSKRGIDRTSAMRFGTSHNLKYRLSISPLMKSLLHELLNSLRDFGGPLEMEKFRALTTTPFGAGMSVHDSATFMEYEDFNGELRLGSKQLDDETLLSHIRAIFTVTDFRALAYGRKESMKRDF